MASTRTMFRVARPTSYLRAFTQAKANPTCRQFITLPGLEATSLSETRILPYSSHDIYALISDIDNYSTFVPYCTSSRVTKWTEPDSKGQKLPAEADLTVGYGSFNETFTSRVLCVPDSDVEALGGNAKSSLSRSVLKHRYSERELDAPNSSNTVFKSISTRWSVKPFMYKPPTGNPKTDNATEPPKDQTEVQLNIDFQFSNPVYGAFSKAVAPKVAGLMIEAFERRAEELLKKS